MTSPVQWHEEKLPERLGRLAGKLARTPMRLVKGAIES